MANTLKFKRGLLAGLPTAAEGEPLFTTDTADLYIGTSSGNQRFQKYIASGTTGQLLRGDGSLLTMPIVLTSPSNGQVLKYDGTNWVNSADAGVTGSGAAGQVTYWGSSSTITGSNNLFWDATNVRLGIGTNTPTAALEVVADNASVFTRLTKSLILNPNFGGGNTYALIDVTSGMSLAFGSGGEKMRLDTNGRLGIGTTSPQTPLDISNLFMVGEISSFPSSTYNNAVVIGRTSGAGSAPFNSAGSLIYRTRVESISGRSSHIFYTGSPSTEKMRLNELGNLILGGTSDNGLRFQVTGDGYFSGSVGIGTNSITQHALRISKNIEGSIISYGASIISNVQSDVTSGARVFYSEVGTAAASFTLPELRHYSAVQGTFGAGSSVTNQFGFRVSSNLTGATNNYGFFGDIASGTGRWNLFMNGSANNYVNGSLGIGSTSLAGINLRLGKTITGGASAYAIYQDGQVQTDVTANGYGFINVINTVASTNVANYFHFRAIEGTIGASTTIANHYGVFINDMTVGTARYGFWGNLSSGTGKWNFYAGGTAANYFNGNTIMGTLAADSGDKFQVNGTMRVSGASTFNANATISLNQNNSTRLGVSNTTAGTLSSAEILLTSDASSGTAQLGKYSSTTTAFKILTPSSLFFYNSAAGGDIAILNNAAAGTIKMAAGGSSTAQFTIASTGAATFSSSVTAASFNGTTNNIFSTGGTERMRLDASGNLGLGVTPSAWQSVYRSIDIGNASLFTAPANSEVFVFSSNAFLNSSGAWVYKASGTANIFEIPVGGGFRWRLAPSGSAGGTPTFTQAMTLFATGNLAVGTTTDAGYRADINGTMRVSGASTFERITATTSGIDLRYNSGILYHIGGSGSYYQYISGADYTLRNRTATGSLIFATQDITRLTIASDGAATFSSSVTAASYNATTENIFSVGGTEGMRLTATNRNLHIGTFSSDTGEKLQVNGTMRVSGGTTRTATIQTNTDNYFVNTTTSAAGDTLNVFENSGDGNNAWAIGRNDGGIFAINHSTGATFGTGTTTNRFSIDPSGAATFGSSVTVASNLILNDTSIEQNNASGLTIAASNASGDVMIRAGGAEIQKVKSTGQVRFVPLASAPSGAEAGDVYYNSTDNKLYCYNGTTWNALF